MTLDPRAEESLEKLADFVQLLFQEEEIPAGVVDFFADLAAVAVRADNALKELDLLSSSLAVRRPGSVPEPWESRSR